MDAARLGGEFVEILGPYNPDPGHAASYSKIFICATQDAVCTRKIVESLERRGYRRPPTEAETQRAAQTGGPGAETG